MIARKRALIITKMHVLFVYLNSSSGFRCLHKMSQFVTRFACENTLRHTAWPSQGSMRRVTVASCPSVID
jgi:hypothetical protein